MGKLAVVAIGGNSISKENQTGTIPEQFENSRETSKHLAEMIAMGYDIVLTHGNGPQVGNILLRVEYSKDKVYPIFLDTCVSDTQGGMGYMLQQVLGNELREKKIIKTVATIVTQVLVDKNDPSFENPSKPIGPFYKKEEAEKNREEKGWSIVEDAGRGYRRVVPSPIPIDILEKDAIKSLLDKGFIVIAVGGGGIPVIKNGNGDIQGVEAVIDKDRASSLLANQINADVLIISTGVEKVCINYKKENEKSLDMITVAEAKKYLEEGQFPKGSMGPKIQASIQFIEKGGKEVIITDPEHITEALKGNTGTKIVR
ncbi:MAG: carbamate kinase [Armatimonadota bacterium]